MPTPGRGCGPLIGIVAKVATLIDEGDDPYLWLEDLDGADAAGWVADRNAETVAALTGGEAFAALRAEIRQVLDADDRIPYPGWRGDGFCYNFWTTRRIREGCGGGQPSTSIAGPSRSGTCCSTSTRWPPRRARTGSGRR
ncbi:hypothetical protein [Micromonospora sp. U21]|uniref:hypothetical protein n=1 Tax=Micromonospora sp. U21 TaxID=2824899 RepID=UPI0035A837D0